MKLNIVSPNGILFEGEAANISFPGLGGSFDVRPHHRSAKCRHDPI